MVHSVPGGRRFSDSINSGYIGVVLGSGKFEGGRSIGAGDVGVYWGDFIASSSNALLSVFPLLFRHLVDTHS